MSQAEDRLRQDLGNLIGVNATALLVDAFIEVIRKEDFLCIGGDFHKVFWDNITPDDNHDDRVFYTLSVESFYEEDFDDEEDE